MAFLCRATAQRTDETISRQYQRWISTCQFGGERSETCNSCGRKSVVVLRHCEELGVKEIDQGVADKRAVFQSARFHPGGTLGKRLLSKVRQPMVSENLPIVATKDKLSDTIFVISRNRQRFAVAMNDDKIVGCVTDGDVRRVMQRHQIFFFRSHSGRHYDDHA